MKRKAFPSNLWRCKGCGYCIDVCPKNAIAFSGNLGPKGYDVVEINEDLCIGCGNCYVICPDYVWEIKEVEK